MGALNTWLETYFDEVTPREFYRSIFPEGSFQKKGELRPKTSDHFVYNGIAVRLPATSLGPRSIRYTVTDDLDVIDTVCECDDFCIMSPISYIGLRRTLKNARILYAIAIDVDRIIVKGEDPVGLRNLWNAQIKAINRIPEPTFIVSSGNGLHLYYVLSKPVRMHQSVHRDLETLKHDLTSLIWHDAIVDMTTKTDVQQGGIDQAFRMPGTVTKSGDRVRAFRTGDSISIETLWEYTNGIRELRDGKTQLPSFSKKTPVNTTDRRIVPRCIYDSMLKKVHNGATVGHRYNCIFDLAVKAKKCSFYHPKYNPNPVTYEELKKDAYDLLPFLEGMTDSDDNHFTKKDVQDALKGFNDEYLRFPRISSERITGIPIPSHKKNGRDRATHLSRARAVQNIDYPNGEWRNKEGRPSKCQTVTDWRAANPDGKKADCIRETGLSPHTVYKHWT